jgi:hypothetical protein
MRWNVTKTTEGDFALLLGPNSAKTFQVTITAGTVQILNDSRATLERTLQLQESQEHLYDPFSGNTERLIAEAFAPVLKRVEQLEEALLAPSRRLCCFLSYRFTESNEIVALKIQQFLTLLNVEVLSGATYKPRQVSEKVLSHLREPLDLIVLLITSNGESMWTRDEIGTAIHRGIALVPLVEKGTKFEPGLFANVEYVSSRLAMWAMHSLNSCRPSILSVNKSRRRPPAPGQALLSCQKWGKLRAG